MRGAGLTLVWVCLVGAGCGTTLASYDREKVDRCERDGQAHDCFDAGVALIRADADAEGKALIERACRADPGECFRIELGEHRPYPKRPDPEFIERLAGVACAKPSAVWTEVEGCRAWWDDRVESERSLLADHQQMGRHKAAREAQEAKERREQERRSAALVAELDRHQAARARRQAEVEAECSRTHDDVACARADFMALGLDPDDPASGFDAFFARVRSLLVQFRR